MLGAASCCWENTGILTGYIQDTFRIHTCSAPHRVVGRTLGYSQDTHRIPSNPYLHLIHAKNEPSNPPAIHHHSVTSASECQFGTCNALCAGLPVKQDSTPHFNPPKTPPIMPLLERRNTTAKHPPDPGKLTELIVKSKIFKCMFAFWSISPPGIFLLVSDALNDGMVCSSSIHVPAPPQLIPGLWGSLFQDDDSFWSYI